MSVPSINQGQTVMTTYQVTGFLSDYRTAGHGDEFESEFGAGDRGGWKAGGAVGCCRRTSRWTTRRTMRGAIYAAQAALVAQQAANPGTQNVIIFLSDGDSNAEGDLHAVLAGARGERVQLYDSAERGDEWGVSVVYG